MNLTEYLKSDIPGAELLLDPSKAKLAAFPFLLGKNEIVFYGQPISLICNSPLFKVLTLEELVKSPKLVSNIELTESNLPGLVFIWIYMNGLIVDEEDNVRALLESYSVLDLSVMLEWADYFNLKKYLSHFIELELGSKLESSDSVPSDAKLLLSNRFSKLSGGVKLTIAWQLEKDPTEFKGKIFGKGIDLSPMWSLVRGLTNKIEKKDLTENDSKWIGFMMSEINRENYRDSITNKFVDTVTDLYRSTGKLCTVKGCIKRPMKGKEQCSMHARR